MRSIIISIIFLFSFAHLFAQTEQPKLQISHLAGDFYIFTTSKLYQGTLVPANGMYMLTNKGAVLFDSPWDTTQFQPLLDSIQLKHHEKVIMCIATHSHSDRTAGLEYFRKKGIKTYTTKLTDEICKAHGEKRAQYLIYKDTVFKIGEHTFQTYYGGAGHAPDNIVIWFNNEKILYGGCLIKSIEATDLGYLGDANVKQWPITIKKIQAKFKDPSFIIPGHNEWMSKNSLDHTLELIRQYNEEKDK